MVQPYFYAGISGAIYNVTSSYESYGLPFGAQKFVVAMVLGLGIQAKVNSHLYIRAEEVCNFNGQYQMVFQNPAIGVAYRF